MDTEFQFHREGERLYLTVSQFEATGLLKHCFSTRLAG
jgi:hypothetical protein